MAFRSDQKRWLSALCRDARIAPTTFRTAYALLDVSDETGTVVIDPAVLGVRAALSGGQWRQAVGRLAGCGYLRAIDSDEAPPFRATLKMPSHIPRDREPRAFAARPSAPAFGLLSAIEAASRQYSHPAGEWPPVPWQSVLSSYRELHPIAGAEERARELDTLRKRLARERDRLTLRGEIEQTIRGVRLTDRGAASLVSRTVDGQSAGRAGCPA